MELNLDEISLLQDSVVLKQKIDEIMRFFQQKGFDAKIKSHSFWDMLYIDDTLRFNLYVSIPVHDKISPIEKKANSTPNRKKQKTFLQAFKDVIHGV